MLDEIDLDGHVDAKGIRYIGKAKRQENGKYLCLADIHGALCRVEVTLTLIDRSEEPNEHMKPMAIHVAPIVADEITRDRAQTDAHTGAGACLGRVLVREVTREGDEVKHVKLVVEWFNPHKMAHTCEVAALAQSMLRKSG